MNIHHNARLTFRGRELLVKRIVEQGLRVEEAAQASGVSVRTATSGSGVIAKKALRVSTIVRQDLVAVLIRARLIVIRRVCG